MPDEGKLQLIIEQNDTQALASSARVNASFKDIAKTGAEAGAVVAKGIDSMTASMLKAAPAANAVSKALADQVSAAKSGQQIIDDFFKIEAEGAGKAEARVRSATAALEANARAASVAGKLDAANDPAKAFAAFDKMKRELAEMERKKADSGIDKLIARDRGAQLSGSDRINQQRVGALADLGKTEAQVKRINLHFDEMVTKAGNSAIADNVRNFITSPMFAAGNMAAKLVGGMGAAGLAVAGVVLGFGLLTMGMMHAANATAAWSLEITQLAARTGLGADQVQVLRRAANDAGVDVGALASGTRKLTEALSEEGEETSKTNHALKQLGISGRDSLTGYVDMDRIIPQILSSLGKMSNQTDALALGTALLGKGYRELAPLAREWDKLSEGARQNALILTKEQREGNDVYRQQINALGDAWDNLKSKWIEQPSVMILSWALRQVDSGDDQKKLEKRLVDTGWAYGSSAEGRAQFKAERDKANAITVDRVLAEAEERAGWQRQQDDQVKQLAKVADFAETKKRLNDKIKNLAVDRQHGRDAAIRFGPGTSDAGRAEAAEKYKAAIRDTEVAKAELESANYQEHAAKAGAIANRRANQILLDAKQAEAGGARALEIKRDKQVESFKVFGERGNLLGQASPQQRVAIEKGHQVELETLARKHTEHLAEARLQLDGKIQASAMTRIKEVEAAEISGLDGLLTRELITRRELETQKFAIRKTAIEESLRLELDGIERSRVAEQNKLQAVFKTDFPLKNKDRVAATERLVAGQANADESARIAVERAKDASAATLGGAHQADRNAQDAANKKSAEDTRDYRESTDREASAQQLHAIDAARDAQLQNLELVVARSLAQALRLEEAKLGIQVEYIRAAQAARDEAHQKEYDIEVRRIKATGAASNADQVETDKLLAAARDRNQQENTNSAINANEDVAKATRGAEGTATRLVRDHTQRVFEDIKSQAGGVFDELVAKNKSFAEILANTLKTALLTVLKDVVTTEIARTFTKVVTGEDSGPRRGSKGSGGLFDTVLNGGSSAAQAAAPGTVEAPAGSRFVANALGRGRRPAGRPTATVKNLGGGHDEITGGSGGSVSQGGIPMSVLSALMPGRMDMSQAGGEPGSDAAPAPGAMPSMYFGPGIPSDAVSEAVPDLPGSGPAEAAGSDPSSWALDAGGAHKSFLSSVLSGGMASVQAMFGGGGIPGVGGGGESEGGGESGGGGGGGGGKKGIGGLLGKLTGGGGGLKGMFGKLKDFTGQGTTPGGYEMTNASMGERLKGFGHSDAFAALGTVAVMDGLKRGGIVGLGETTLGGAAIGFKYGGPLGAAIGAAAGAIAGTVRLFVKSHTEQIMAAVKDTYGVTITREMASQIDQVIKSKYGNSISAGIRSPEVV